MKRMNGNQVVYSMDKALGVNRTKELEKNEKGYYKVVLSLLDVPNSVGLAYRSKPFINVLNDSNAFGQYIDSGQLYGECGHPRKGQMTDMEYLIRINEVYEDRQMFHISQVWTEIIKDVHTGKSILAVLGWIKPSGVFAHVLQAKLDNPEETVAFSLRGIAPVDIQTMTKTLKSLTTWDYVTYEGLKGSNSLNARAISKVAMESDEVTLNIEDHVLESMIATESNENIKTSLQVARQAFIDVPSAEIVNKPSWL